MDKVCKLCGHSKPLIKAHVIPQVMFKEVFGNNKVGYVDFQNDNKTDLMSDAAYDTELFCRECDNNLIGGFESYFTDKILGKRGPGARKEISETLLDSKGNFKIIKLSGLNYNKLKLFFLSLLLRASLSSEKFFRDVDIEPYHTLIKNMLLTKKACGEKQFKVCLFKLIPNGTRPFISMIPPRRATKNGNTFYIFYINTLAIFINISNINIAAIFNELYLKENGTLEVTHISGDDATKFFDNIMGKGVSYNAPFKL